MKQADELICRLIEDVISGRVDDAEFRNRSKQLPDDASRDAMDAWHTASHFLDDADIRARDAQYAGWQMDRLKWHISVLRAVQRNAAE
jgi:hypothetical protein